MIDVLTSVGTNGAPVTVPDTPATAWRHSFPTADLVSAATGLFSGHRIVEPTHGVTLLGESLPHLATPSGRKGAELFPNHTERLDRSMVEGPRWYVTVSPGTVAVRSSDPARAERAHERAVRAMLARQNLPGDSESGGAVISSWSAKSRANMTATIQSLDWAPLLADGAVPAMVTLTYPGRWRDVVPHAAEARRHLLVLRKRFERAWGVRWRGVWKREFQLRGAPHWHILCVPPTGQLNGEAFPEWLSRVWSDVVAADTCGAAGPELASGRIVCCERHRHRAAGTGIDYVKGARSTDPRRIGVYFSKHGSYAAKDAQNDPPAEWVEHGSVGRFWGVWGLTRAVAGVSVSTDEARAALRTLRRHSRANAHVTRVPVFRYRTVLDPETGDVRARWRKSSKLTRVYRLANQRGGFVATADGPALASAVARGLDRQFRPADHRPGDPRPLP